MKRTMYAAILTIMAVFCVFGQIEPGPNCYAEAPTEVAAILAVEAQGCIVDFTVDKDTFWQAFGHPCNDKEPCFSLVGEFLK